VVEELKFELADVRLACKVLGVSASGFYAWDKRPPSARIKDNVRLAEKIKFHWETSRKTYGRKRLTKCLQKDGEVVGKNRVERIMKEKGIRGKGRKKFKPMTTTSNHALPVAKRVFKTEDIRKQVTMPNQYWGGDITYIPTKEGWLYLAIYLDLFTRKIVGYAMKDTLHASLVTDALRASIGNQGDALGLIAHTDRGSQYASEEYAKLLHANGIAASMSRKGNCYDNAMVESFFRTLKVELIYGRTFATRTEAVSAIFEYIEVWYNRKRLHSSLDYQTPTEYETKHLTAA
jgi:transposase InsO family protein